MSDDALARRVEDAGLNASAPLQQRLLDGWLMRLSPGKAKRARCINALAPGHLPLTERLLLARQAFHDAGLPIIVRITPFTQPASLDSDLAREGWCRFDDTRVMLWPRFQVEEAPALRPEPVDSEAFAWAVGELRGSPPPHRQAHAERLRHSPVAYQGFVVRQDGRLAACGQFARESDLVGLYDVLTAPEMRRQGLATGLCRWLLRQAAQEGARHAYLQVEGDNAPARKLYQRLGFEDVYAYHYRTPDAGVV